MSMAEKIAVVTGGTGGIGKETARGLANMGVRVILVGRDSTRGEAAATEINLEAGSTQTTFIPADLSSLADVRTLAARLDEEQPKIDILVNNAGGLYMERRETVDGFEAMLAMNHISPFLLTTLLQPALLRAGNARVINLSSGAHNFGKIDYADLQAKTRFSGFSVYSTSKLINLIVTLELAKRWATSGIMVNIADPGGADTEMTRGMTPSGMPLFMRVLSPIFRFYMKGKTAANAARSTIYLATSPEIVGKFGRYISPSVKEGKPSAKALDPQAAERLWNLTQTWIGADKSPAKSKTTARTAIPAAR